jgi:multiple sugar transport system permease protein
VREEIAMASTQFGRLTPITPRYQEIKLIADNVFLGLNTAEVTGVAPEEALRELDIKVNEVLRKEMADWEEQLAEKAGAPKSAEYSGLWTFAAVLGVVVALVAGLVAFVRPLRRRMAFRLHEARHMFGSRLLRREAFEGIFFASPWLTGLVLLQAFPILFSIALSFCEWDPYEPISEMRFVGMANYARAASTDPLTGDPDTLKALYNTFYYALFAVPLSLMTSLGLALLLNQKVRGITIFRTTFYLPSIVAGVATVILWTYIFNPIFGPINNFIRLINNTLGISLPTPLWLGDPAWSKPALIIMTLWAAGGAAMLIFLAGLQGVPDQLYEVAELDGAGRWRKFWNVTIPMLTPTIYFNLIMGIIASLKVFMQAFIMTNGTGGVDKSLLFFVLHLYVKGFIEFEMGYASALAWILFVIILLFTLLVIRSSAVWVYYEGERRT